MTETAPRAKLTPKTNAAGTRRDGTPVDVHFNPESMALTIRNTMEAAEHHTTAGRPSPLSGGGAFAGAGAGISFGAPPAAFASGDAGFGLDLGASAGAGLSLGAGAGAGAGASLGSGAGISLGAGAGIGLDEAASFSAGGGALELGAFAALNAPKLEISAGAALGGSIDFELPDAPGLGAVASLGAGVSLGGAASAGAQLGAGVGGGQVAEVGREINLADILFKEED